MKIKNKLSEYIDTVLLALGELVVAVLVSLAFLLFGKFSYKVVTGALLGGAVMALNLFILTVSLDRAVKSYADGRGEKEMTEEEIEAYTKENGMKVQLAMAKSMLFRLPLMIGILVLAMISKQFSPLATVIPLIMYRPILHVSEIIKIKLQEKRGD